MHRHAAEDVLRSRLGVLHLDVEIAILAEPTGIDELVLHLLARARAVHRPEIGIRNSAH
jgi:hypothetical protein